MKNLSFVVLILMLSACSENPVVEREIDQLVIHAVLSRDYEHQTVFVSRGINILNVDGLEEKDFDQPVSNATVVIKHDREIVQFDEVSPGMYKDVSTPLNVIPGETYYLEASDQQGNVITAVTTVPDTFRILSPKNGDSFARHSAVTFRWNKAEYASFYFIGFRISQFIDYGYITDQSAEIKEVTVLIDEMNPDSINSLTEYKISATDSAYFDYIDWSRNPERNRSNIKGGAGVFGALTSASVYINVYEVPEPESDRLPILNKIFLCFKATPK